MAENNGKQVHMLTTVDNPFNPVTHFDEWNNYDLQCGYHTLAYLARVINSSTELSDADQSQQIEFAIEEICEENVNGLYRKVVVE